MTTQDPGLDLAALRGIRGSQRKEDTRWLIQRVTAHLERHGGYISLSGGKDSVAVLDLARQADPAVPVAFFDSGIEFPETYDYVADLADEWDLNLHTYRADPTALQVLAASGFWDHDAPLRPTPDLFETVMLTPARLAHEHHGPGLLWGVRAAESRPRRTAYLAALAKVQCPTHITDGERRKHHGGVIEKADGTVAYGPVWDWSTEQIWGHLHSRGVPINPVYDKLRAAGAPPKALRVTPMIEASAVDFGALTWLKRGWPDMFEQLAEVLPRMRDFT